MVWEKRLDGGGDDRSFTVILKDNQVYIAGLTTSSGAGGNDGYVALFSSDGSLSWLKTIGGSGDDRVHEIVLGSDGRIYGVGLTGSFGAGEWDVPVLKIDPATGQVVQCRTVGSTDDDDASRVIEAGGFLIVAGFTYVGAGGRDAFTFLYSPCIGDELGWTGNEGWDNITVESCEPSVSDATSDYTVYDWNVGLTDVTNGISITDETPAIQDFTPEVHKAVDSNTPSPIPEGRALVIAVIMITLLLLTLSKVCRSTS